MNILKTNLGYLENFTKLQGGKIVNQLEKLVRYNGVIYNYKDYIITVITEGYNIPKIKENYTYCKRNGEMSKPKNLYILHNGKDCYIELNKTIFNFAKWLIDSELTTLEKIKKVDEMENIKLEKIRLEEEEKEKEEEEKRIENERTENEFKINLEGKIKSYDDKDKINLAEKIHFEVNGVFYERSARLILVLIENFDKKRYKNEIKEVLHLGNKASRKVFEYVTGLKLPKTYTGTIEYLNKISSLDFIGMKEFIPKKSKLEKENIKLEKFYIRNGLNSIGLVEGEKINHLGLELYIRYEDNCYSITEKATGAKLIDSDTNKSRLLKTLKEKINIDNIKWLKNNINKLVEKNGVLPEVI